MKKIALVGNPNTGKTSLFNQLTGLNQKVGNFSGVTIERKSGYVSLDAGNKVELIDLPGTYSIYPKSPDEKITTNILLNIQDRDFPDLIIVVVDASNIERSLLLFRQVQSLEIPVIIALNMLEIAQNDGLSYDISLLSEKLNCPVLPINARKGLGLHELKHTLQKKLTQHESISHSHYFLDAQKDLIEEIQEITKVWNLYYNWVVLNQIDNLDFISEKKASLLKVLAKKYKYETVQGQRTEVLERYAEIRHFISVCKHQREDVKASQFTALFDKIALHPIGGYVVFFVIILCIFQAVFKLAEYPMDYIDQMFTMLSQYLADNLSKNKLTRLLTEGIITGVGGVVIFVPQIAILFASISVLEESGYMARAIFIVDKPMQKLGLNGKSVIPLISGMACAIPAIMATRTITNEKERFLTIFVTPFMSCSARLPIYTVVISLVIPEKFYFGFFSMQGLVLTSLYLLGVLATIISAFFFKQIIRSESKSMFVMEIPKYRIPRGKNIMIIIFQKCKIFVLEAGKIILAVSVIIWCLSSYAPNRAFETIERQYPITYSDLSTQEIQHKITMAKLEASYMGLIGKTIEPALEPLGYDWKISIAIFSSFVAREVFIGTIATIYSVGSDNGLTIRERMKQQKRPDTGEPLYNLPLGFSLLIFYAFAMQCVSTLAVVYKETGSWKYPVLQFCYMTYVAYFMAYIVYNLLS